MGRQCRHEKNERASEETRQRANGSMTASRNLLWKANQRGTEDGERWGVDHDLGRNGIDHQDRPDQVTKWKRDASNNRMPLTRWHG
jgi:hypothetical protein